MGARKRREEERRARWEQIVGAARKVFCEKGYHHSTISDIEKASRLTSGAIFYYFKGKDEIYISALIKGLQDLRDGFRRAASAPGLNPEQQLINVVDSFFENYRKEPEFFKMAQYYYFAWESEKGLRPELIEQVNNVTLESVYLMLDILKKGNEEGYFSVDPIIGVTSLWILIANSVHLTKQNPRAAFMGISWDYMKAGITESILAIVRGGLPAKEKKVVARPAV
ncbi:MAG: TetR/AcrR family transcriptional regulator [Candidatus Lindowbacteria bacterium]|nr:TetR/AcrR family transcriptional regulator [Candidatus Lindowbacteria bacterium]